MPENPPPTAQAIIPSSQPSPTPNHPNMISRLLDNVQRLICMGLATWHFIGTSDVVGSLTIFAAGFIDARMAKTVLMKFLRIPDEDDE